MPSLPVTLVLVVWGLAAGPLNPLLATVAYERVPPHMRGRVFGAAFGRLVPRDPGRRRARWAGGRALWRLGHPVRHRCRLLFAVTSAGVFNRTFRLLDVRPEPGADARMSKRDLFRNRGVLGILAREVISLTGSQMTWVALPWFVLTTSGSATRMTARARRRGRRL